MAEISKTSSTATPQTSLYQTNQTEATPTNSPVNEGGTIQDSATLPNSTVAQVTENMQASLGQETSEQSEATQSQGNKTEKTDKASIENTPFYSQWLDKHSTGDFAKPYPSAEDKDGIHKSILSYAGGLKETYTEGKLTSVTLPGERDEINLYQIEHTIKNGSLELSHGGYDYKISSNGTVTAKNEYEFNAWAPDGSRLHTEVGYKPGDVEINAAIKSKEKAYTSPYGTELSRMENGKPITVTTKDGKTWKFDTNYNLTEKDDKGEKTIPTKSIAPLGKGFKITYNDGTQVYLFNVEPHDKSKLTGSKGDVGISIPPTPSSQGRREQFVSAPGDYRVTYINFDADYRPRETARPSP